MKKILIVIITVFLIVGWLWLKEIFNYKYNMWFDVKNIYATIWDIYEIWWEEWKYTKICNKKEKNACFAWFLKWIKIINNNEAYIYFDLTDSNIRIDKVGDKTDYWYNFFWNTILWYVKNKNELPIFWYIKWQELKLYNKKDISSFETNVKNIYIELEKNPTIEIEWKKYKNHLN